MSHTLASIRGRFDSFDVAALLMLLGEYAAVAAAPFGVNKYGDHDFHREAKALAAALHGALPWSQLDLFRAPAPVLYYGIPYSLLPVGSSDEAYWRAGFVWTVLCMALALLLVRRTASMLFSPHAGRAAVLLVLAMPFNVYYSFGINAETCAYLGTVLLAFGWARWRLEGAPAVISRWLALALGGLSLLLLARPNSVLVLPLFALAWTLLLLRRTIEGRRQARFLFALTAGASTICFAAAGVVRLMPTTGKRSPQADNLAHVVMQGRFQFRTEPFDWRFWDNLTRGGSVDYRRWADTVNALAKRAAAAGQKPKSLYWAWIARDVRGDPVSVLRQTAIRSLSLNVAFVNSRTPAQFAVGPLPGWAVYLAFHLAVNVASLLALVAAIAFAVRARRRLLEYAVFWAPYLALLIFHALTYAEPRYLFPGSPGVFLLASPVVLRWAVVATERLRRTRLAVAST